MDAIVSGQGHAHVALFAKCTVLLEVADQCGRQADKRHQGTENKQVGSLVLMVLGDGEPIHFRCEDGQQSC
ncbi:hypothetical protein ABIE33_005889 [Ensifer sp. 4252]